MPISGPARAVAQEELFHAVILNHVEQSTQMLAARRETHDDLRVRCHGHAIAVAQCDPRSRGPPDVSNDIGANANSCVSWDSWFCGGQRS